MPDQELKYKISGDASKFVAEAKKAKQAEQDIGKGSANSSLSASNLKNANQALDAHSQKVANLAGQYKKLESTRSFFDKQPKALAEIDKQQVSILRNLERQSKSEQELAKYMGARLQLQQRMGQQFSAHSERQFGQLQGAGMAVAGQLLGAVGGVGRQLYSGGMGTYQQLNAQYRFDQGLTASERGLTRSQVMLGSQLAPYQAFKNNALAAVNNSGLAAPLAIGGDILGTVGPAAGGALQLAGALKLLKGGGAGAAKAATSGVEGISGVAEGAAGATGILGKLGGALGKLGAAGAVAFKAFEGASMVKDTFDIGKYRDDLMAKVKEGKLTQQEAEALGKAKIAHRTSGIPGLSEVMGLGGLSKEQETALEKKAGLTYGGNGLTQPQQNPYQQLFNSPQFKIQMQRQLNQISDFQVDTARQETLLRRGYARQGEDITRSRTRAGQDYSIAQQRIGISAQRLGEDTTRSRFRLEQDYAKQTTRLTQDSLREQYRSNVDYGRQVEAINLHLFRVKRDTTVQSTRLEEDYTRNITRLHEDSARQLSRLEEDSGRNLTRLEEDTNRERTRSYEDYVRSKEQLSRQSTRSEQDINRGLSDTAIGLFAPGLAGNKAYQWMKAVRDANTQRKRLREDVAFESQGIERGYRRGQEDISRGEARGREDIERERGRGREDIGREATRGEEDLAREKTRASFDLLKQSSDALKDSQIALRDATTGYQRQQEDIARENSRAMQDATTSYSRGLQDINTEYARGMQDLILQQRDTALQFARSIEDLDVSAKRAKEDFETGIQDLTISRQRFTRDLDLSLQEEKQSLMDLGASAEEATKALAGLRQAAGLSADKDTEVINVINSVQDKLKNIFDSAKPHAQGLNFVPQDNYLARLHAGEMVVPANQATDLRTSGFNVGMGIDFSKRMGLKADPTYGQNLVTPGGSSPVSKSRLGALAQFFGAGLAQQIAQGEANAAASRSNWLLPGPADNRWIRYPWEQGGAGGGGGMQPPVAGAGNRNANVSLNFTVNNDGEKRSIQAMGGQITGLIERNFSGIY